MLVQLFLFGKDAVVVAVGNELRSLVRQMRKKGFVYVTLFSKLSEVSKERLFDFDCKFKFKTMTSSSPDPAAAFAVTNLLHKMMH